MSALLSGIFLLIGLGSLGYMAWRFLRNKAYKQSLFIILLMALILRVIGASDPFLHNWDERYHAVVAKNVIAAPLTPVFYENPVLPFEADDWIGNNIWVAKPVLPFWLMAGSMAVFGENLVALRLPSLLLGLLAVWLTFLIGRQLFDERIGVLAAFFHAINGLVIELGGGRVSSDHVELCFIVMVQLGVYFAIRQVKNPAQFKFAFLAGVFMGFAFLSKWYPGLLVLPVWFTYAICQKDVSLSYNLKAFIYIMAGFAISALPWTIFMLINYPEEMEMTLLSVLGAYSETVQNHNQPFYYFWRKLLVIFGELIYLPLGFAVYKFVKDKRAAKYGVLLAWVFIPLIIFSLADTKRFTYILIAAPAFFILTSWFWFYIYEQLANPQYKVLKLLVLVAIIALPVRYGIERTKFFGTTEVAPPFYYMSTAELSQLNEKSIVFGTKDYAEMLFHTNVGAAYQQTPSTEKLNELVHEGYTVYLMYNLQLAKYYAP